MVSTDADDFDLDEANTGHIRERHGVEPWEAEEAVCSTDPYRLLLARLAGSRDSQLSEAPKAAGSSESSSPVVVIGYAW